MWLRCLCYCGVLLYKLYKRVNLSRGKWIIVMYFMKFPRRRRPRKPNRNLCHCFRNTRYISNHGAIRSIFGYLEKIASGLIFDLNGWGNARWIRSEPLYYRTVEAFEDMNDWQDTRLTNKLAEALTVIYFILFYILWKIMAKVSKTTL